MVKGFDFDTLLARKPELKPELTTLRDQFMTSDEEETVKVRPSAGLLVVWFTTPSVTATSADLDLDSDPDIYAQILSRGLGPRLILIEMT